MVGRDKPDRQRTLDYKRRRRRRLTILQHVVLPDVELVEGNHRDGTPRRVKVKGGNCVLVLRAIENFLGDNDTAFPSHATIAEHTKALSERTVMRCIKALEGLQLLSVEERYRSRGRQGRTSNSYRPIWSNLLDYVPAEHVPNCHEDASNCHHNIPTCHGGGASLTSQGNLPEEPPPPQSPSVDDQWAAVAVEIRDCGVAAAKPAVEEARGANCTPEEIREVVAHWKSKRPAWAEGALYWRIKNATPGQPATEGWPPEGGDALNDDPLLALGENELRDLVRWASEHASEDKRDWWRAKLDDADLRYYPQRFVHAWRNALMSAYRAWKAPETAETYR